MTTLDQAEGTTRTKNTEKQMRNRENAMPQSVARLEELLRSKIRAGGEKPDYCMWVSAGVLAKLHFALARKRQEKGPEGEKWRSLRLRKTKKLDTSGERTIWEIWLQDKASTEVEGIDDLIHG